MTITLTKKSAGLLTNEELIASYGRSNEMTRFVGPYNKEHTICALYAAEMANRGLKTVN